MTDTKIVNEPIRDERKRDSILIRRFEGMSKKAKELEMLCGIETAMVVHKKDENNFAFHPSQQVFGQRLQKFLDFNVDERNRKMATHDKYKEKRVSDESESLAKLKMKNDLKESQQLMNSVMQDTMKLKELDLTKTTLLNNYVDEMLKKLQAREDELNAGPGV